MVVAGAEGGDLAGEPAPAELAAPPEVAVDLAEPNGQAGRIGQRRGLAGRGARPPVYRVGLTGVDPVDASAPPVRAGASGAVGRSGGDGVDGHPGMLPRVALEYGHTWCAASASCWAVARSTPGIAT